MPGASEAILRKLEELFALVVAECAAGRQVALLVIEFVLMTTGREFEDLDAAVKQIRSKQSPDQKGSQP